MKAGMFVIDTHINLRDASPEQTRDRADDTLVESFYHTLQRLQFA